MGSKLESFLFEDKNSRTKESLVNNRLRYDLKLAAALSDYDLSLYTSDVDRDGFDIILDDHDSVRKMQLKTVLKTAATTTWFIHKAMLRPEYKFCAELGFELSPSGTGVQGGVILMELDPHGDSMDIRYHYTDVFVIAALSLGIVMRKRKIASKVFNTFYSNVKEGDSSEKVKVPKSFFVEAKSPGHLLGLMGLHNNRIANVWWNHLISIGKDKFVRPIPDSDLPVPKSHLRGLIADELLILTVGLAKGTG